MRSTCVTVTFLKPFKLPGVDGQQPSGSYEVMTDEEEIPGLSFVAWHRVGTSMRFPSIETRSAQEQWVSITPDNLETALRNDHPPAE